MSRLLGCFSIEGMAISYKKIAVTVLYKGSSLALVKHSAKSKIFWRAVIAQ